MGRPRSSSPILSNSPRVGDTGSIWGLVKIYPAGLLLPQLPPFSMWKFSHIYYAVESLLRGQELQLFNAVSKVRSFGGGRSGYSY